MIANHHKTFQCQLSYFNCQLRVLAVVYLMQDLYFQIMLLDGSFIHVDDIFSHYACILLNCQSCGILGRSIVRSIYYCQ